MTSQTRDTDSGTRIPPVSDRPARANVDGLTAGEVRRLDTLRARIRLADAAGHDEQACQLRAELALREDGAWQDNGQDHHHAAPRPVTPPPTQDGRMVTVDQVESPKPSHRRIGEKKLRHVRVETPLWVLACQKAEAEGLGISEVVRRLLDLYVRDEGVGGPENGVF